ncbi:MAG TPA: hypothetical protein VJ849_04335 [Actinomycetes bacterium]|nr:hypothetical protein [Actinomycetes bacterium]
MATDRDERQRDQQRQELEEIRRSFAEMGARMGSLFEPAEADEPEPARQAALPTPPATPAPGVFQARPGWWWAGLLALLFVAGTAFGWLLPRGGDGPEAAPPPQATTATTAPQASTTQATRTRTVVSVPEACVDAAELADEVISRLNRNDRDNRLALALRDYTIASQACRREASP